MYSVQNWCLDNDISEASMISFPRNANSITFSCASYNRLLSRSHCVRDIGLLFYSKLCFHHHINYVFFSRFKNVVFVSKYFVCFLHCWEYFGSVQHRCAVKFLNSSVSWNCITATDSSKLESVQRIFEALCLANCLWRSYVTINMKAFETDWIFYHSFTGGGAESRCPIPHQCF
jgi:hypothetical protein